jgi:hypothetical protein
LLIQLATRPYFIWKILCKEGSRLIESISKIFKQIKNLTVVGRPADWSASPSPLSSHTGIKSPRAAVRLGVAPLEPYPRFPFLYQSRRHTSIPHFHTAELKSLLLLPRSTVAGKLPSSLVFLPLWLLLPVRNLTSLISRAGSLRPNDQSTTTSSPPPPPRGLPPSADFGERSTAAHAIRMAPSVAFPSITNKACRRVPFSLFLTPSMSPTTPSHSIVCTSSHWSLSRPPYNLSSLELYRHWRSFAVLHRHAVLVPLHLLDLARQVHASL